MERVGDPQREAKKLSAQDGEKLQATIIIFFMTINNSYCRFVETATSWLDNSLASVSALEPGQEIDFFFI